MVKELLLNLALLIILPVVLLLVLIMLPITAIQVKRDKQKLKQFAEEFVCLECGVIIGADAIRLADERWSEIVKKIIDENDSEIRLRLVRSMDAICPHCGCVYLYHKADQTFVVRSENQAWKKYEESMVSAKEL